VVTADHASAMVYAGFATPKDHSVLGFDKFLSNVDKKPYQLLTYASGIGFEHYNETTAMTDLRNSYHKANIPSTWGNHAGDDVPLYAIGALSNLLFSGSLEQNYVPHAIAFAMCLFNYQNRCYTQPYANRDIEFPRAKKPNKIHLLRQKLQDEINREKHKNQLTTVEIPQTNFVTEADFDYESTTNNMEFTNETDTEYYETSDLVGNSTNENSGKTSSYQSFLFLPLFVSILINFVR
jgi:hypothetical protein